MLRWRKEPNERGLASPRGAILRLDGEDVGRVRARYVGYQRYDGWYWTARCDKRGIPLRNTASDEPYASIEEAKDACKAYVRECLSQNG